MSEQDSTFPSLYVTSLPASHPVSLSSSMSSPTKAVHAFNQYVYTKAHVLKILWQRNAKRSTVGIIMWHDKMQSFTLSTLTNCLRAQRKCSFSDRLRFFNEPCILLVKG
jgi:hypothetical protein